ncbi:pentatricopeptide repeat-containing protein At2g27800, mitochondrial-like isoform X2 [Actinidia eriantha]|uniref:pentatricopeptide repeat-containing protein At2g27800, mitochondrial-like isoform X2 n=1 Tax=Actinidia eriantha TaxID=165200 RepID=UPI0025833D3C|nr:pentatricopeptide repeat-containing protein At2g27800, mitochondrial-like isoform X2 [Actinidia eriantha]
MNWFGSVCVNMLSVNFKRSYMNQLVVLDQYLSLTSSNSPVFLPPRSNFHVFSHHLYLICNPLKSMHLQTRTHFNTNAKVCFGAVPFGYVHLSFYRSYSKPLKPMLLNSPVFSQHLRLVNHPLKSMHLRTQTQFDTNAKVGISAVPYGYVHFSFYHSYSKPLPRSLRRRINKRLKSAMKPVLDEARFQRSVSQLPPRFTAEELCNVITLQEDPLVCLELFNWASEQPRFRHDVSTYHITIKKLGAVKMYEEMEDIVNQVLDVPDIGSEALYNTIIYFFTEDRKLTKAVDVYKHMRNSKNVEWRPSIRTFNLLFSAFLSRGTNSYINHMYMETIRCLFKQMVNDGIEPDIFSLNSMIKGYVLSLHVNDALRIFHQMGVVYNCLPNSFSFDYLIHGLCAQGRTKNARDLFNKMKKSGFVPSSKSYNSLVNSLALGGEVDKAVNLLWEMIKSKRSADFITYRTVLDEICRQQRLGDAMTLLKELQEKELVDSHTYRKLLHELVDSHRNLNDVIDRGTCTCLNQYANHIYSQAYYY